MRHEAIPRFAIVSNNVAGDNEIIPAQVNERGEPCKIKVTAFKLVNAAGGANNITFKSGTAGANLTGGMGTAIIGQITAQHNPKGWFETAAGQSLNMVLTGAFLVAGCVVWEKA